MRYATIVRESLVFHARAHMAVLLSCATAAAVICGALLVGDSVKGSLRDQALTRLGDVEWSLVAPRFFTSNLAKEIGKSDGGVAVPAILLRGSVVDRETGARAGQVNIIGVDETFRKLSPELKEWGIRGRSVVINRRLADELSAEEGHTLLLRFEKESEVAREHVLGDRRGENSTAGLEVLAGSIEADDGIASFDLRNQQQTPRNVFVSLARLQRRLEREDHINAILWCRPEAGSPTSDPNEALRRAWKLVDIGVGIRRSEGHPYFALESSAFLLPDAIVTAGRGAALEVGASYLEVLTYLANTIAVGDREIPYSTVSAVGLWVRPDGSTRPLFDNVEGGEGLREPGGVVLNSWALDDLGASPGQKTRIDYFAADAEHDLTETGATFDLRGSVPLEGDAADPDWTPRYPGVSDVQTLDEWDPPIPIDQTRFRKPGPDDDYWKQHRTTPKAFISLVDGERLWGTRFGRRTSIRMLAAPGASLEQTDLRFRAALRERIDVASFGLSFRHTRQEAMTAAAQGTDFGVLFVSMSFFIIVSALLLAAMTFRLALERRVRELGLLGAVGYPPRVILRLLLTEGLVVALTGAAIGVVGGIGYAALLIEGLRTLWRDAVNTPFLELHVVDRTLAVGFGATALLAALTVLLVVRGLVKVTPTSLLSGRSQDPRSHLDHTRRRRRDGIIGFVFLGLAAALLATSLAGALDTTIAFFGVGTSLLVGGLALLSWSMRRPLADSLGTPGIGSLVRLGARNGRRAVGRSLLTAGLIAGATFIVVTVGASRSDPTSNAPSRGSGDGGFALVARSDAPIFSSLSTATGIEALGLDEAASNLLLEDRIDVFSLRERPGDETSCLNLYRPREPRILGLPRGFVARGGFRWGSTLARTDGERKNPWLLLEKDWSDWPDDVVPAVGDLNTLQYILHVGVGEDLTVTDGLGRELRLRIVGTIPNSILQGSLAISESDFLDRFPRRPGWSTFFIQCEPRQTEELRSTLESGLEDFGFDARTTGEMLADFNRVQNTYLSTFLVLGGLGVLLGTLGLGAVLLRNVNERRGEFALLRAVGYSDGALSWIVLSETATLLLLGVGLGAVAAVVSVAPNIRVSGSEISWPLIAGLLLLVVICALASAIGALRAALRSPLLASLRRE